jgi:TRAP transporter 4TM/12TM fusion protein
MNLDVVKEQEQKMANENTKTLSSTATVILKILAAALVGFHIYTAYQGNVLTQSSVHFLFALTLAFFIYPFRKGKNGKIDRVVGALDWVFALLAIGVNVYYIIHAERIIVLLGYLSPTTMDYIAGVVTVVLMIEAARRALGIVFPAIAVTAILYALYGNLLTGIPFLSEFAHQGYTFKRFFVEMYMGQQGIFQGTLLSTGAKTIAIFIVFGAMLVLTGGGETFIRLAMAIAGRLTGGPAKVSTLSSALFGSINGSTAANTATTGVFTIPLMKRYGYKSHFAGGVEAAASCGGQILPPIMGAAAFVLAEVTNTNYILVAAAALIPALLYYFGVWMSVHFEAKRLGLKPIESKDMPKFKEIILSPNSPALFIPMFVLIGMLIIGYTPTMSAVWAVMISLAFYFIRAILKKDLANALKQFFEACIDGGRTITMIAVILGTAQVIATVISMTGLGNKISNLIVGVGDSAILVTLILGMIVTIIMGMGVPTVAAYMLSASVIYPAFSALGFPVLASHLFILYYAILSGITPPVALAAYVGASISGSHWFKTSIAACKIGLSGFLIPYMFLFNPALLGQGEWHVVTIAVITAVLGIIALAGSTIGYLFTNASWLERGLFLFVALLLIQPGGMTDIVGFVLFVLLVGYQYMKKKKSEHVHVETSEELIV